MLPYERRKNGLKTNVPGDLLEICNIAATKLSLWQNLSELLL
jgi:hypothetical protein